MKRYLGVILVLCLFPSFGSALEYPELHSDHVMVYDLTDDKVLYSKNSLEQIDIASLTKILTTMTALEHISNLEEKVMFTSQIQSLVRWDASVAGLRVGDVLSYQDLLYASILPSGADATLTLAIHLAGSVSKFVEYMNELAVRIGMNHSHFVNVTGLDETGHYSTVEDVLLLLKYALQNDIFKEIYTTKTYTLSNGKTVSSTLFLYNQNHAYDTSRILGSKTGFTLGAGLCISAYFQALDHDMILITLGAERNKMSYNLMDALTIIQFIDRHYHQQVLISKGGVLKTLPVQNSTVNSYEIVAGESFQKYLADDYDSSLISFVYEGKEELSFWDKKDSYLGKVSYYYDHELLKVEDIYLKEELPLSISKILVASLPIILAFFGMIVVILLGRKIYVKKVRTV